MKRTLAGRLNSRLVAAPDTACRLWTGCTNSRGYGVISDSGKRALVHRVAWQLENGPIPDGMTIDHVWDRGCRYKTCALVAHLEPVTIGENNRRGLNARLIPGPWPRAYRWKSRPGPRAGTAP